MSVIDFEKDLPAYIRKMFPKLSVNSAAIQHISKLLNIANARLYREMENAKKKSILHGSQFAVDKILPKQLVKLAKPEAMRQLAMYEMGLLDYSGSTNGKMEGRRISSTKTRKNEKTALGKGGKTTAGKGGKTTAGKGGKTTAGKGAKKTTVKRKPLTVSPFTTFKLGISKLHSNAHSYLSLEKDGSQYLSSCLYHFIEDVASRLTLQDHKEQVGPAEIKSVLADFLGPALFKCALSEGTKFLLLLENDWIKFDPKVIQKRDPKMFSSPIETHSFRPGIIFLLKNRFGTPFAAVDNSSEYVEHVLLEVARLFGSEVGGSCGRAKAEFMDENDVKNVMEDVLPGELRRHAIARADKALAEASELYQSNLSNVNGDTPGLSAKAEPAPTRAKVVTKSKPKSSKPRKL